MLSTTCLGQRANPSGQQVTATACGSRCAVFVQRLLHGRDCQMSGVYNFKGAALLQVPSDTAQPYEPSRKPPPASHARSRTGAAEGSKGTAPCISQPQGYYHNSVTSALRTTHHAHADVWDTAVCYTAVCYTAVRYTAGCSGNRQINSLAPPAAA